MDPGELNRRVTIQAYTQADDGAGGVTEAWTDVATVWAKVEPQGDLKVYTQGQNQVKITHVITIRHRSGLDIKNRLVFNGEPLDIRSVRDPGDRRQYLILSCEGGRP